MQSITAYQHAAVYICCGHFIQCSSCEGNVQVVYNVMMMLVGTYVYVPIGKDKMKHYLGFKMK